MKTYQKINRAVLARKLIPRDTMTLYTDDLKDTLDCLDALSARFARLGSRTGLTACLRYEDRRRPFAKARKILLAFLSAPLPDNALRTCPVPGRPRGVVEVVTVDRARPGTLFVGDVLDLRGVMR